jgi:hypothetical protein
LFTKTYEQNIAHRDAEIGNLGTKHGIRPNSNANGSLDKDAVAEFTARLQEVARAQTLELERMHVRGCLPYWDISIDTYLISQGEYETRSNEYQSKKTRLQTEENSLKHEKDTLRNQMVNLAFLP